jgi:hypothetical protein
LNWSREIGIYPSSNLPVQYLGRGILNLFDQGTAIGRHSTYQKTNGVVPNEMLFYTGQQTLAQLIQERSVVVDPRFLLDNQFQYPLQARLRFKFIF